MPQMSWHGRYAGLLLAGVLILAAAPAYASANVDCAIDDKFIKVEIEAIAGRTGPINRMRGSIVIKPAAGITPSKPEISFGMTELSQQWIVDGDLNLYIDTFDETTHEHVELIIQARHDSEADKYFGKYRLRYGRDQTTKELKGRIKECVAG